MLKRNHLKLLSCVLVLAMTLSAFSGAAAFAEESAQSRTETGDGTLTVVESTASPFKFCASVLDALGVTEHQPGTKVLGQLTAVTGREAPLFILREHDGSIVCFSDFLSLSAKLSALSIKLVTT